MDKIILADGKEFDDLLNELSQVKFIKPEAIEIVKGKLQTNKIIQLDKNNFLRNVINMNLAHE
ncbi:MAG: hypothetical protein MRERV_76c006 [Mycoplasmataceae bacterium RV_VA103A]|nr:MAG: hypothetical protein MRERV_76c006 [Mycoplasmataceae bacterium RV_VA103A]